MSKKSLLKIATAVLVISIIFFTGYYLKQNIQRNRNNQKQILQTSSDIDFADFAESVPENILDKQKEKYNNAIEKLKEDPNDFEANMQKASVLYFLNEYEKAIIVYQKLAKLRPKSYLPFKGLGDCYSQIKDYAEAEKAYLKTIENNPYQSTYYISLAEIYRYHLKDNREKIEEFYQKGIKKLGSNRFNLIQAYASQLEEWGEDKKALEQWKLVLENFP